MIEIILNNVKNGEQYEEIIYYLSYDDFYRWKN